MDERINNIEFLRIIACIAIVAFHLICGGYLDLHIDNILINKLINMSHNAQRAVELFFIISGFFFGLKLDLTQSLFSFMKKKILRVYPVAIFMLLLGFIISFTHLYDFDIYTAILVLFGLSGTALVSALGNYAHIGPFWYVSSMLWTFALYFYILKNYKLKNANFAIAVLTYMTACLFVRFRWDVAFFNNASLRGLCGIGIGYFISQWYKTYSNKLKFMQLSRTKTVFLTVLEFMCLYFIFNNLLFHNLKFENNMIYILVFSFSIILFISKKGYISRLLDLKLWNYFSKYTFSIFLSHSLVILILNNLLWLKNKHFVDLHPLLSVSISWIIIITFGVLVYHFVEKPANIYIKKNLAK